MSAALPFSTMEDAALANLVGQIRAGISAGNAALQDARGPSANASLKGRLLAITALEQAETALRGETPLPRTDLPVPDGPGVPRGRHVGGERDPRCGGRPHP